MNGLQHFMLAEQCLSKGMHDRSPVLMDAALIHAQLATAAAMFGMVDTDEPAAPDTPIYNAMTKAAATPLVPCPETAEEGAVLCELPIGHDGLHEGADFSWSTDKELSEVYREHQAEADYGDRCDADGAPDEPDLHCTEAEGHSGSHAASGVAWPESETFRVPRFIPAH